MHIDDLVTPSVLVDRPRLLRNIERMARRTRELGVALRPHVKTHKCIEIARMQGSAGIRGITVSTLFEARVFADAGFDDITYAFPIAPDKFSVPGQLAERVSLNVILDNPVTVDALSEYCESNDLIMNVLLKVDVGYHRAGVLWDDPAAIHLVERIARAGGLEFRGILTHEGHVYDASTPDEIREIEMTSQRRMVDLAERLARHDERLRPEVVSVGSTPGCSLMTEVVDGITEVRPGNYVFYDYEQVALGSCTIDDCALLVLASVVGTYGDRLIIDAGATTLSVDAGPVHLEPDCGFGKIVSNGVHRSIDDALVIAGLSQEHGKIRVREKGASARYRVGDRLWIVPNHSCLTANLSDWYVVVDGDRVVDRWGIHRGRL